MRATTLTRVRVIGRGARVFPRHADHRVELVSVAQRVKDFVVLLAALTRKKLRCPFVAGLGVDTYAPRAGQIACPGAQDHWARHC